MRPIIAFFVCQRALVAIAFAQNNLLGNWSGTADRAKMGMRSGITLTIESIDNGKAMGKIARFDSRACLGE